MTARLEKAVRQLPPEQVKLVERYAESLAVAASSPLVGKRPMLDWIGAASNSGKKYSSGVEAAHDANRIRVENAKRAAN